MKKIHEHLAAIVIVILVIILAFLGYVLWRQYMTIQRVHTINSERFELDNLHHQRVLTANDTSYIQPWMTFDYIAFTFNVPPDYLQKQLNIDDPKYPHISISRYSKSKLMDPATLTNQTQDVVRSYLSATSTPSH